MHVLDEYCDANCMIITFEKEGRKHERTGRTIFEDTA